MPDKLLYTVPLVNFGPNTKYISFYLLLVKIAHNLNNTNQISNL